MFYDIFCKLCVEHNVKPTNVATAIGVNRAAATKWKKGSIPNGDTLRKIADYFSVTVDYLLTGEIKKSPDEMSEDEEINEMLEDLKNNPGKRLLFSKTKHATKEDIEKIIAVVDILTGGNDGGSYY